MLDMLRFLKTQKTSLMNASSSLLPLPIKHLDEVMYSLIIEMVIVRGV